jgi:hypothetical protein
MAQKTTPGRDVSPIASGDMAGIFPKMHAISKGSRTWA